MSSSVLKWELWERYTLVLLRLEFGLDKNDPRVHQLWRHIHGERIDRSAATLRGDFENRHGEKRGAMYEASIFKRPQRYTAEENAALGRSRAAIYHAINALGLAIDAFAITLWEPRPDVTIATGSKRPFEDSDDDEDEAEDGEHTLHDLIDEIHSLTTNLPAGIPSKRHAASSNKRTQKDKVPPINWTDNMRRTILIFRDRIAAKQGKWSDYVPLFEKICEGDIKANGHTGKVTANHLMKQSQESTRSQKIAHSRSVKYDRLDPKKHPSDAEIARAMERQKDRVAEVEAVMAKSYARGMEELESDDDSREQVDGGNVQLLAGNLTIGQQQMEFVINFVRRDLGYEQQVRFFSGMFPMLGRKFIRDTLLSSIAADDEDLIQPASVHFTLSNAYPQELRPLYALQNAFDYQGSPLYFLNPAVFEFGKSLQMVHRSELDFQDGTPHIAHEAGASKFSWFVDKDDSIYKYGGPVHRIRVVDPTNNLTAPPSPLHVSMDVMLCDPAVCKTCADDAHVDVASPTEGNAWIHANDLNITAGATFEPKDLRMVGDRLPPRFKQGQVKFFDGVKRDVWVCGRRDCQRCKDS